jgi:hypothetical protein
MNELQLIADLGDEVTQARMKQLYFYLFEAELEHDAKHKFHTNIREQDLQALLTSNVVEKIQQSTPTTMSVFLSPEEEKQRVRIIAWSKLVNDQRGHGEDSHSWT